MACSPALAAYKPKPFFCTRALYCALLLTALSTSGCEREALKQACPQLSAGDLVVSELRGKQSTSDSYGQWIELYNASSKSINLSGITLRRLKLDGSGEQDVLIRAQDLTVDPGSYVVLGRFDEQDLPSHVDYGFGDDWTGDLYTDGLLEVWSCQQLVDRITYQDLPSQGTLAYDGSLTPDAEGNDDQQRWCVDQAASSGGDGGAQNLGIPGTPRAENRPCNN